MVKKMMKIYPQDLFDEMNFSIAKKGLEELIKFGIERIAHFVSEKDEKLIKSEYESIKMLLRYANMPRLKFDTSKYENYLNNSEFKKYGLKIKISKPQNPDKNSLDAYKYIGSLDD